MLAGQRHPDLAERWLRGRKHRTRNAACRQRYRGFESHPLRHDAPDPGAFAGPLRPLFSIASQPISVFVIKASTNGHTGPAKGGPPCCDKLAQLLRGPAAQLACQQGTLLSFGVLNRSLVRAGGLILAFVLASCGNGGAKEESGRRGPGGPIQVG